MAECALAYLNRSLSVIPLAPREKKPHLNFKWQAFQYCLPSVDEIRSWFGGRENNNNIGVITGGISKLLVVDIDGDMAKTYADNIIHNKLGQGTKEALDKTVWTRTGSGGYHILIRYDPDEFDFDDSAASEIKSMVLWRGSDGSRNEVRLKSDGGYVILPPSVHPNGNVYRFVNGNNNDIVLFAKEQILELIHAVRQRSSCRRTRLDKPTSRQTVAAPAPAPSIELDDERVMDIVVILRPHYLTGQRHDFVLYLSGWLRKEGIAVDSARKVIEGLAEDDEELDGRLLTLKGTYEKEDMDEIKGYAGLSEILESQLGGADVARQVLKGVQSVFPKNELTEENEEDAVDSESKTSSEKNQLLPSASEIAIELVDSRAVLYFKDEYGTPHVKLHVGEHTETMPVDSHRFELFVSKVFYDEMGKQVIKSEALNEVIRILMARTIFDGVIARVYLRTAWGMLGNNESDYGTLYYDPTTEDWSCIKVTTQGWESLPRHPDNLLFTRFKQLPQVMPTHDYAADIMDRYLDLMHIKGHAARLLVKVLLIASFIPDIGHPITVPNGEQGGVKSTYCRYHKRLVDPTAVELLTIPKDRNEFVQHMHHNYVVVYDNVRIVPNWFSDEICKAVTGAGNSKRKLYTDDEDIAYNYKRCILVNGINNVLTEPDALDRSVMLDFTRISDEQRREEAEVDAEFDAMKPGLLGYVLDILVKALSMKPTVELQRKPRMADFTVWGEAIARAMGCRELEFVEAYYSVLERQNVDAVEATLIGPAIVNFVGTWPQGTTHWEGSPDALLDALRKVAEAFRIDARDKMWPKKGNCLTRKLKPLLPDLRQGYQIDIAIMRDAKGEKTKSKNSTWITINRKIPPTSPPSPPESNTSTNNDRNGGDTPSNGGDNTSTNSKISPPKEPANHAHFEKSGGIGDSGDTFRLSLAGRGSSTVPLLDGKDYVAFDLEWRDIDDSGPGNWTIYAAAFVDNHGNQRVLHVSDFANSEPALLKAITDEILKYPISIGWYTTGGISGSRNGIGGGVSAAA